MNLSCRNLNLRLAIVRSKLTWLDSGGYVRWNSTLFWIVAWLSFSCQKGNVEQHARITAYEVDTVLIDSKGRILDLAAYMQASDVSSDGSSFFLYNHHDLSIDEINLDRKEFVKSYPLEAEGSNGVGQFIFGLQMELEELYDEHFKYFVKDGKLWVGQNFSDELGFLVFDF